MIRFSLHQIDPDSKIRRTHKFCTCREILSQPKCSFPPPEKEYQTVYEACQPSFDPDAILTRFNMFHPKDFTGHSLSTSDIIRYHLSFGKILISALCGSIIAILNFAIMCLTVQSAVGMTDQKKMKAKFQLSYNARMVVQSAWVVAAFLIPQIHFIAGAAPVLFPKVTILYLQATGKLMPAGEAAKASEPTENETH